MVLLRFLRVRLMIKSEVKMSCEIVGWTSVRYVSEGFAKKEWLHFLAQPLKNIAYSAYKW